MDWLECGVLLVVAALATMLLVPFAKRVATRFDAIDYPAARRVNRQPIPRMGGVALFGGIIVTIVVLLLGVEFLGWEMPFRPHPELDVNYWGLIVGVVFMFAVGFVDDVVSLNPRQKLLGQIVAACIVAGSGVLLSSIHNPIGEGDIEFGLFAYPLTVFYLVAFANVINLIDGLDGLAAGITTITAVTIFIFAVLTFRYEAAIMSVAIIGACLGFLRYNFHPASIFMGDSGALLLGFSLGIVSLFAVARSALFVSLLVPILAAGVPITDTALAIIRRKRAHRPIDEADRGHIHHRLMDAGFSHRKTVLIMWGWTAVLAICAVFITLLDSVDRIPFVVIIVAITAYGVIKLRLLHPVLLHHYNPRARGKGQDSGSGPDDGGAAGSEPGAVEAAGTEDSEARGA